MDTGAFYAALNARDAHHAESVEVFRLVTEARIPLVTSKWVVVEAHSLVVSRAGTVLGVRWLDSVPAAVLSVTSADEVSALRILRTHLDKDFSLVDASSFALMTRLGIRHYHSYDGHFKAIGRFIQVTPSSFE